MKLRTDLHISRKVYHICGLTLIIVLYSVLKDLKLWGASAATVAITIAVLTILPLDYLRIRYSRVNKTVLTFFKRIMRDSEMDQMSAMSSMMIGAWVVIVFFPAPIVYLTLMLLAIGDPAASIVGVIYGKDKILGNKSLQGTFAGFLVCTLIAFFYYWNHNIMVERLILVSLITGIIGATAEIIPVGKLDDNLSFPVIAATSLTCVFYVFGGFP